MSSLPPPDRLTDEEMSFVRPGNSLEIEAWNREFVLLVDEYCTALAEHNDGWASERVAEIRKCLGGLQSVDSHLVRAVEQTVQHQRRQDGRWG